MPPQLLSSRRPRAIALVVTLMLAAGACSGGDDDTPKTGSTLGDSRNDSYKGSIDLKLGPTTVASSSDVSTLDRKVAKDVLAAVGDFVDAAVVEPLLSGKQAKNLERFFGLRVYTRVQTGGKDRAALSDENLPDIAADVEATADPVGLDALVGSDGTVLMIGAKLSLHVRTETADGPPGCRSHIRGRARPHRERHASPGAPATARTGRRRHRRLGRRGTRGRTRAAPSPSDP